MIFGYTPLDPIIVLIGTGYALYLLSTNPTRLIGWMPAALSFYFFIPFITFLTFWQTIPLLLSFRALVLGRIVLPSGIHALIGFFFAIFLASALVGVFVGFDTSRAILRTIYYIGVFALFAFAYEVARQKQGYELFLKGLVITGVVLGVYGLYQIFAFYGGLPLRGILRGTLGADVAFEAGLLRINSLANEPKRLGYVLFLCAFACLYYAKINPERANRIKWSGVFIFTMSLFTFAGSYFLALVMFGLAALFLYPSRILGWVCSLSAAVIILWLIAPDLAFFEAVRVGYERRLEEIEIGLDGTVVYRQEFFGWDFLGKNPLPMIFGTGLGQYYAVLNQAYGTGVGYNEYGGLLPMNSLFLELILDFGAPVAALFYGGIAALIIRLRNAGEPFLALSLLFLLVQSFSILTMHFIVVFAGVGLARLKQGVS